MRLRRRLDDAGGLPLTPLIDMVFLVVIFFMLNTALAVNPAIKVQLPEAYTSQAVLEEKLIVTLTADGAIYLGRQPVGRERFAGELKGVAELAATAPGVAIRSYGGLGQLSTISIRGSNAGGVRILLDGIPLDTAAGGSVDLSTIPLHWVDRVEVVRGAEGAYYGASSSTNATTRRARSPPRFSTRSARGCSRSGATGRSSCSAIVALSPS